MASADEGPSLLHLSGRSQPRGGRGKRPASTSVSSGGTENEVLRIGRKRRLIRLRFLLPRTSASGERPRCDTPEQGRSPRSSRPDDSGPSATILREQQQELQPDPDPDLAPAKERRSRSPRPHLFSPQLAAAVPGNLHQPRPASPGSGSRSASAGSASQRTAAAEEPPTTADFSHPVQDADDACAVRADRLALQPRPRKTRIRKRRAALASAVKRRRHRHSQDRRDRDLQRKRRRRNRPTRRRRRRSLSPPGLWSGGSSTSCRPQSPISSQDSPRIESSGKEITLARNWDKSWRPTPVPITASRRITNCSAGATSSGSSSPRRPDSEVGCLELVKLKSSLKDSASLPRLMFTRFDLKPYTKGGSSNPSMDHDGGDTFVATKLHLGLFLNKKISNRKFFTCCLDNRVF